MRSASVVIDDLCGCPTTPALNMTNHPYYKFSKCVLAKYTEESFISRLQIHADDDEEEFLSGAIMFFAILDRGNSWHLSTWTGKYVESSYVSETVTVMLNYKNKTKGTSCRLIGEYERGMCIRFYPLDNTTAGDSLAIDFKEDDDPFLSGFGVCLIYKEGAGDRMEVEPTTNQTNPFNIIPIPNHLPRDDDQVYNLLSQYVEYL